MNENKKVFKLDYAGKEVTVETGRMAKQADGSALVTCGGTQVLVTACSAKEVKDGQDFFPLLVEYTEKFYAAGKFLGGFLKREGRPSTQETLNARLIDRPLRPLFPSGYMFDTVISCTVLSYDEKGDPEVLAGLGASAALSISDIPFNGPIGSCKVGRINGELILNPSYSEWAQSDMEISVAASKDAILMVEGESEQITEDEMLDALMFAHDQIKLYCEMVEEMVKEVGRPKREFVSAEANGKLKDKVKFDFTNEARAALSITDKLERQNAIKAIEQKVAVAIKENPEAFGLTENDSAGKESFKAVDELLYEMLRTDILKENKRIGGRSLTEVRPIETEVDVLVRPHGSALFTRGETQVLSTVTVGGSTGEQMSDRIVGQSYDRFYLHYNFPPFSVGEARGVRGVGRRELGHGNLAERAIKNLMPSAEEFSYTARVVCEVLESNGSSSMGSVCAGAMALLDAGVPIKAPVAGIAMGLVTDGSDFKILTDILGDEDHLGDMDFKVAGTEKGITAIQMDIKIEGITKEIIRQSLAQAKEGRLHILGEMAKTITSPREQMKEGVPRIEQTKIDEDKIGMLIGPSGKNIKALQEEFQLTIEVGDGGVVKVIGTDNAKIHACLDTIELQINGPKIDSIYEAEVVSLKDYGMFVDIAPGVSGLVHISELADDRVNDVSEYVSAGDKIKVKVIEIDRLGRLKLSAKAVEPLKKKES
ncbi:MAG: polyribonucleotide nucleotidyltransferase [Halobacteriovoraceae bacterium]|nr:polyribonucleotide nucleotidyltransferase [Halobacteriovoraceae bacterium]